MKLLLEKASGIQVVGEASDGQEAVRLVKELAPDIVIMDIGIPLLNGPDAATQILRDHDRVAIIVLSMYTDESYVVRALEAGQRDICSKTRRMTISNKPSGPRLWAGRSFRPRSRTRCRKTTCG